MVRLILCRLCTILMKVSWCSLVFQNFSLRKVRLCSLLYSLSFNISDELSGFEEKWKGNNNVGHFPGWKGGDSMHWNESKLPFCLLGSFYVFCETF